MSLFRSGLHGQLLVSHQNDYRILFVHWIHLKDKNSRGETPYEILQSNTQISAQAGFHWKIYRWPITFSSEYFWNPLKAKDECSKILKPKEEKGKLEDEADKLLAMREKLKKEKEEAEKKRLAEENAAAEAKGRVPPIKIWLSNRPDIQKFRSTGSVALHG